MVLDGRDLGPLAVDVATTIEGPDGLRWRVLARRLGGGRPPPRAARARGKEHRPGPPRGTSARAPAPGRERPARVLAAWASLEPVEAEIRWLAAILPLISLGLWALAAAIGRHFARRALAPLALMAESARAMPFDDGRLPSPGTRDELEDFARSFNGLLDRLHVALERQRQFTGQASHQLRTPLAALIAAIEVARRRPRTVEEHERVLDRLHDDAVRLWRVVEALLFLARADAEAELPDLERLDLAAWAADHLGAWSGHERAADLRFEASDGAPLWPGAPAAARPVAGQPARERLQVQRAGHADRRPRLERARRRRDGGGGPRLRHPGRRPAARLRAVLSRRVGPPARPCGGWAGAGRRPAHRRDARRHDHRGERAGPGQPLRGPTAAGAGDRAMLDVAPAVVDDPDAVATMTPRKTP